MSSLYKLRKDLTGDPEREKTERVSGRVNMEREGERRDSQRRGWKGGGPSAGKRENHLSFYFFVCK